MIKNYRVLKEVDVEEKEKYRIEGLSDAGIWVLLTYRTSLALAKVAIEYMKGQEIVSSEVVYEC